MENSEVELVENVYLIVRAKADSQNCMILISKMDASSCSEMFDIREHQFHIQIVFF